MSVRTVDKSMEMLTRKVRRILARDPRWRAALDLWIDDQIKTEIRRRKRHVAKGGAR